ncbi:DinB family protein [Pseudofulvibacter geojedonensis]|uniref:DinB family protein n=1 Tax=Pseudofulvibacter geojedonensis TaxID=1123758 RepID=A0ABW3I568_9FLAO
MIHKLHFSIDIKADTKLIWKALWNDHYYRNWTGVFFEGSHAVTNNWEEGSIVHFLAPDKNGIYSNIEKHIPNKTILFKHIGLVKEGKEIAIDDETKKWTGASESYTLTEEKDYNILTVEIDVLDEHLDFMKETFPKALERIKSNCNSISSFNLDEAVSLLSSTPTTLISFLKDLPENWIHQNEGENTWSPFDIIGHLIHGEKTDWIPRTRIILENHSDKKFAPFDRFAQFENSKGKTLHELLMEFKKLRKENLIFLKTLKITEQDLLKEGIHPEFGTVTLQQLLATWVTHDLGHIAQIAKVMAKKYKNEVGPWSAYIKIVNE